jgi:hypothetical protein
MVFPKRLFLPTHPGARRGLEEVWKRSRRGLEEVEKRFGRGPEEAWKRSRRGLEEAKGSESGCGR